MTVVMATQDAEAAARFADRLVVLHKGQIVLDGTPRQVFSQVERLDAWGIDVPQLARLSYRLGQISGRSSFFLDSRSASQALAETGLAGAVSAPVKHARATAQRHADPAIKVRSLGHQYPRTVEPALSDIDLDIWRGEWLAIIGINGSGKSTLVRHFNGLLKPSEGTVSVEGLDTRVSRVGELARIVSILPQNPALLLFSATVRQEVGYGPRQLGLEGAELETRVADTLDLLELSDYAKHPPAALGYGLRRQVALASILAMDAPILVLDEPTVGLDHGAAARLLNVVAGRHCRGTTVVMITHDLRWVARYAQRVVVLSEGRLVASGPTSAVLADIDLLREAGLDPLPVTALAHSLGLPLPLPLTVDELLVRDGHV
jgi:energy-coupling factor transport system ATP-binding protein